MELRTFCALGLLALALAIAGCGGDADASSARAPLATSPAPGASNGFTGGPIGAGSSDGANAAASPASTFTPAAHAPLPSLVSSGGPVLSSPRVIPIFFEGDPLAESIRAFLDGLGATDYWRATTSSYGIGPIASAPPVVLEYAAPEALADPQVAQLLANAIANGELPREDPSTIFALFFPSATTVTIGADRSCTVFGGYHSEGRAPSGQPFVYAVIPRCENFDHLSGIDMVTVAASHELVEASTDPLVTSAPAYQGPDADHALWGIVFASEAGDLCVQNANANVKLPGFPFTVQRSWSNIAAGAGHDPCAPALSGEVYFNTAPAQDDSIQVTWNKTQIATKGVKIATGQTRTIDLALWSDGPTSGPWEVNVIDLIGRQTGHPLITTQLSADRGQNGDHIALTITLLGVDPGLGVAPFLVRSTLGSQITYWVGAVSA